MEEKRLEEKKSSIKGLFSDSCFVKKLYEKYPNTMVLTLLGLIISLLFIILGFWATLLIILLSGAGFIYGQYRDKSLWVYYLIKRFLK